VSHERDATAAGASGDARLNGHARRAIPVFVNAAAGTGCSEADCKALEQAFHEAGAVARVVQAHGGADLMERVRKVAEERPPVIVAGGGDGTVSAVASVVAGTPTALGVLPLGTLNHFAKDLGIPLDRAEAARTIVTGQRIQVDVGEVNGRVFINNSSLGLYPRIVLERTSQQRRLGRSKWSALFWATLTVLRRSPFLTVRLKVEDEARDYHAALVFIGNNRYVMEGFDIGARERLDCGVLSIYITQRAGRRGLLGLALRALAGRLHQARDFEALTTDAAEISTRRSHLHVAADGEVTLLETPLRYRVRPRDLHVIVPASQASAQG
jgi:diacylglycerol kinase family enzyme